MKNIASFFIRPILEEQALLREKLKTMPTWKKDKDPAVKRKTQPMVSDLIIDAAMLSLVSLNIGHLELNSAHLNGNSRFYTQLIAVKFIVSQFSCTEKYIFI